jgi:hypothetical protein
MNSGDWIAVGACATGVMAVATFILAWKTRSMALATERMVTKTTEVAAATLKEAKAVETQVQITTHSLSVGVQPWLTWVPGFEVTPSGGQPFSLQGGTVRQPGWYEGLRLVENDGDVTGWLTIQNVGNGLALLDVGKNQIFPRGGPHPFEQLHPTVESPVISPGQHAEVQFCIRGEYAADAQMMTISELTGHGVQQLGIELAYSDVLGGVPTTARFEIVRQLPLGAPPERWRVYSIEYRRQGSEPVIVKAL